MNAFSKLFVAVAILFSVSYASATVPSFSTSSTSLTAQQCVKLRSELDKYIAYVNAWLAAQPLKKQKLLKPYVDYAIAEAKKYVNTVCPQPPAYDNKFSTSSPYECRVNDSLNTSVVSLGVNEQFQLVNTVSRFKTACMSLNACANIAPFAFIVNGVVQSAACADPQNQNVRHLTDAEVQTSVNQIVGN